jgi:hypothetical protein
MLEIFVDRSPGGLMKADPGMYRKWDPSQFFFTKCIGSFCLIFPFYYVVIATDLVYFTRSSYYFQQSGEKVILISSKRDVVGI